MFKNLSLLVALVLFSVATTFAQKLPNIHIPVSYTHLTLPTT